MSKFGRRIKNAPDGFECLEPILSAIENELREKVNEPHEGLRKNESQWPIHQLNWQKSRYVYDMYYTYNHISKEVYDYCIINKIVDANLIAKWKKPGYERLCSTYVINPRNYKFGTVSICRVPKQFLAPGTEIEDPTTGCRGCASGSSANIFGNKYGQYLAAIQIAREEKMKRKKELEEEQTKQNGDDDDDDYDTSDDDDDNNEEEDDDDLGPVGAPDGSSGRKSAIVWASNELEQSIELRDEMIGELASDAKREAMLAISKSTSASSSSLKTTSLSNTTTAMGPPGKRVKPN